MPLPPTSADAPADAPTPCAPRAKVATREDLARMFKLRYPPLPPTPPTRREDVAATAAAAAPPLLQSLQQSGMMPPVLQSNRS